MKKRIVVTGAAGFIAANVASRLNREGFDNLILVDNFEVPAKRGNWLEIRHSEKIDRAEFPEWLRHNSDDIDFIFHLGARTDTAEFDMRVFDQLNVAYSKALWAVCVEKNIPFLYASSAATYGAGEKGFDDAMPDAAVLHPLNPYGYSKQIFDLFVLAQQRLPPFWCGLKFFNVYGPREAHKGRMASVALHAYRQIKASGKVTLFRSHRADYKDGEQQRDFVFVNDVADVCFYFYQRYKDGASQNLSGIYNVGTGQARTFNDLARALFTTLQLPVQIEYKDIPQDIREKYQYYTQAKMGKLRSSGYPAQFTSLEKGIADYVRYLEGNQ